MKLAKLLALSTLLALSAPTSQAQRDWSWDTRERFSYNPEGDHYAAQEFTIDLFGSYSRGQNKINDFVDEPEGGSWGGGIGMNYFFTRMVGIGADASMHDNGGQFVDNAAAHLVIRFPIGSTPFAPYIFGGGGRIFDPSGEWEVHTGVGVEWRLNARTGIFADGRYIWPDSSGDASMIRTGLRFAF